MKKRQYVSLPGVRRRRQKMGPLSTRMLDSTMSGTMTAAAAASAAHTAWYVASSANVALCGAGVVTPDVAAWWLTLPAVAAASDDITSCQGMGCGDLISFIHLLSNALKY